MRLSGCYYHIFPPVYSTPTLPRSYVTYCDLVLMVGSFQTSSYTAIGKLLPQSANTICGWILDHYHSARETLQTNLRWTHTAVHITFDVWTSPNHRSFLAVVGHYYDYPKNETRQSFLDFDALLVLIQGRILHHAFGMLQLQWDSRDVWDTSRWITLRTTILPLVRSPFVVQLLVFHSNPANGDYDASVISST